MWLVVGGVQRDGSLCRAPPFFDSAGLGAISWHAPDVEACTRNAYIEP